MKSKKHGREKEILKLWDEKEKGNQQCVFFLL